MGPVRENMVAAKILWPLLLSFVIGGCFGELNTLTRSTVYLLTGIVATYAVLLANRSSRVILRPQLPAVWVGCMLCLFSCIGALIGLDTNSLLYTLAFLITWLSLCVVMANVEIDSVLKTFAWSGLISAVVIAGLSYKELIVSISSSAANSDLMRFQGPFKAHPNFLGHVFGCYAVTMFFVSRSYRGFDRALLWFGMALSVAICLAASSRGGLFAAVGAVVLVFTIRSTERRFGLVSLMLGTGVVVGALMMLFPSVLARLATMLELTSKYRGVGTGLTGRVDEWRTVLSQLGSWHMPYVWGAGFRSEWLSNLVAAVDNSYIVAVAELGCIALVIWLVRMGAAAWVVFRKFKSTYDPTYGCVLAILAYHMAEAIVARYMIAIGNPASILGIALLCAPATSWGARKLSGGGRKPIVARPSVISLGGAKG